LSSSSKSALLGTVAGTLFWGLSGTASQALFEIYHFPALGLALIRMSVSGLILLIVLRPKLPESRSVFLRLLAIAVFGFVGSQVFYLLAIQYTNAPTATLLQFLFLPMVAAYEALTGSLHWTKRWSLILAFAAVGTLLLIGVFSGSGFQILITPIGLVSGLLAAASGAYYSLASRKFVKEKGPWWLLTWGFVTGAFVISPLGVLSLSQYKLPVIVDSQISILALVSFVTIFGTILAYGLYLSGLRHLPATEIGVVTSLEPVAASIAAYVFLGNVLGPLQYLGGGIILLAVILTASKPTGDVGTTARKESGEEKTKN
jgi:drug/metabolite transporter (DMT)-like permease